VMKIGPGTISIQTIYKIQVRRKNMTRIPASFNHDSKIEGRPGNIILDPPRLYATDKVNCKSLDGLYGTLTVVLHAVDN